MKQGNLQKVTNEKNLHGKELITVALQLQMHLGKKTILMCMFAV
jgi:hypothetical protein